MDRSHSDYSYRFDPPVLFIEDLDRGRMSVTNNAENVIAEIAEREGPDKVFSSIIIYRDSRGIIDMIHATPLPFGASPFSVSVQFQSLNETDYVKAREKAVILHTCSN